MFDVIVRLLRNGVVINGTGRSMKASNTTAVLGKAVLGKMKLGAR